MAEAHTGMKCDIEVLTPTQRKLRVEVPADRVAKTFSRIYREFGRRAKVRGFRAGKVPQQVLRGLYGADIQAQALSEIVEASLGEAVKEQGLDPVAEPRLDAGDLSEAQPFTFSAVMEVRPDIELGNYRGIALNRPRVDVDDEQVERTLEAFRERHAQLEPVEEREQVEDGDYVFIDFAGTVDGEAFPGGSAENFAVDIGAGKALPEFERGLVGMKKGVPGTLVVDFPADSADSGLAGRKAEFTVTVRDIRRKDLPPLDDDFAQDYGECESLEELRDKVRAQLQDEVERFQNTRLQDEIVEHLLDAHSVDTPPSMVERELSYLVRRAATEREPAGTDAPAPTTEELREELTPAAERRVRASLLIDEIASAEGITVSEEEVDGRIDAVARAGGERAASVREHYRQDWARATLQSQMVADKTLDFLLEQAAVTVVEPSDPSETT
ncbi:MAG: trigger factor [Deltaproteobacteria bacterium]|nr:trigger factor [Deltaproteobacteria bacterium]